MSIDYSKLTKKGYKWFYMIEYRSDIYEYNDTINNFKYGDILSIKEDITSDELFITDGEILGGGNSIDKIEINGKSISISPIIFIDMIKNKRLQFLYTQKKNTIGVPYEDVIVKSDYALLTLSSSSQEIGFCILKDTIVKKDYTGTVGEREIFGINFKSNYLEPDISPNDVISGINYFFYNEWFDIFYPTLDGKTEFAVINTIIYTEPNKIYTEHHMMQEDSTFYPTKYLEVNDNGIPVKLAYWEDKSLWYKAESVTYINANCCVIKEIDTKTSYKHAYNSSKGESELNETISIGTCNISILKGVYNPIDKQHYVYCIGANCKFWSLVEYFVQVEEYSSNFTCNVTATNVYAAPSKECDCVTIIQNGTVIKSTMRTVDGNWIQYDSGWVLVSDLDNGADIVEYEKEFYQKWEVIADGVNLRAEPLDNAANTGYMPKESILTITKATKDDNWIYYEGKDKSGWIKVKGDDDVARVRFYIEPSYNPNDYINIQDYNDNGNVTDWFQATSDNLSMKNAMSILGLPYQFLESADTPLVEGDKSSLGRIYAEKIFSRTPLLLLTPGKPKFMTNFRQKDKESVIEKILNITSGDDKTDLEDILDTTKSGRYYTFEFAYNEYYNFLNPMLRMAARMLNLQNETLDVNGNAKNLDTVDWQKFTVSRINSLTDIGTAGSIPFYINSNTQISDSIDNSTGDSMIASTVGGFSDTSRELGFLLGYGSNMLGHNISPLEAEEITSNQENFQSFLNGLGLGKTGSMGNFLNSLSSHVTTVISGGRLIFPEIWNSSSIARSYDITMKFVTPDCDKLSWYLNICVPVFHLLAMALPRSVAGNPSAYISPFLVRGYYKGLFNCDMGIITSMSISKGDNAAWTKEGLPTVVEVSFTLKDLYDIVSISDSTKGGIFSNAAIKNTALMDYIANFCGININKPEVMRQIDIWFTQSVNRVTDLVTKNIWGTIEQGIQNKIMNIYNSSFR